MTIDFGFDVGNDPPPRHVNPTVSNDGYMAVGGQLVYVGVPNKQSSQPRKVEQSAVQQTHPDDDWIFFDTYCIYVGQ